MNEVRRWNQRVGRWLWGRRNQRVARMGLKLLHHDRGLTRLPVCALTCDCHKPGLRKWFV